MPGRQGVAPLRFGTRYHVDRPAHDALARILECLPVEKLAGHRESPLRRVLHRERGEGLSFFGTEFVCDDRFSVESWPARSDLEEIRESIRLARQAADWVVVSLHTHEYDERPDQPAAFAAQACREMVDAGAEAVIAHGAHGVRGIELHQGRPIFHGVGAFVFQPYLFPHQPSDFHEAYAMEKFSLEATYRMRKEKAGFFKKRAYWEAMLVRLTFARGDAPAFEVSPIALFDPDAPEPDGLPRLAHNEVGRDLLRKIQQLSVEMGTPLTLDPDRFTLTCA